MNETATSAPGVSLLPSSTDASTAAHLAIIAILVVLTISAILYGMKLARRRHTAARDIEEHNAAIETATPARTPAQRPEEPIATDVPVGAPPAVQAAPILASRGSGDGPVTQLKGLGPKVAMRLGELGITTVGQLAALDESAAVRLDDDLGTFKGRMVRDRWLEQARLLAAGDKAGFEGAFGKL